MIPLYNIEAMHFMNNLQLITFFIFGETYFKSIVKN